MGHSPTSKVDSRSVGQELNPALYETLKFTAVLTTAEPYL
jgi:hypothetical protein